MDGPAAGNEALGELMALLQDEPDCSELAPFLSHATAGVRAAALSAVIEHCPHSAGEALGTALGDPDPKVREVAISGAEELRGQLPAGSAASAAILRLAESDPSEGLRAAAVRICRLRSWESADWFARRLSDAGVAVRKEAVAALVALDALEELAEAGVDPSPLVRRAVAERIARVRAPGAGRLASRLLGDPDPLVAAKAAEALAALGHEAADLPVLLRLWPAGSWEVRKGVAMALGGFEDEGALSALGKLCADSNADVRKEAVRSLGAAAGRAPIDRLLRSALDDPDADVRAYARMALEASGKRPLPERRPGEDGHVEENGGMR